MCWGWREAPVTCRLPVNTILDCFSWLTSISEERSQANKQSSNHLTWAHILSLKLQADGCRKHAWGRVSQERVTEGNV